MKQTALIVAALGLLFATAERAAGFGSGDQGTSGAVLKISIRGQSGMGKAFVGVADDVAVYYNPAVRSRMSRSRAAIRFSDMSYEFAAAPCRRLGRHRAGQERLWGSRRFVAIYRQNERRGTVETDTPSDPWLQRFCLRHVLRVQDA